MSTHNQARNKQTLNDGLYESGLDRPSTFRRTVAWLTLIAYVGQPLLVTAQTTADQAAVANKRPVVDVTANGIPLVQIATPNAAGLSHNQYNQFNVDPAGLILNNSQTAVQTQQAGYIVGNPNLANGTAHIILNEVTGTSHSQLNGYIEVAGQQAEVIVANPNGITCNGCGFINANRGVLTTGTPVIGMSGSLDAFRVTGGNIQIGSAGLNGNNLSQLDLIARSVQVNGQLWGTNLSVITGANLVDYNTLGVQVIQGEGAKPTVGIDVALLGGMYANKIRLIGTEAGVGVNSLGTLTAQAGDFYLDYQGQITLMGSTSASGNLTIHSNTGISNTGSLYSQQATQLTSAGSINNAGNITAIGTLGVNSNTDIINSGELFGQQAIQLTGSRSISNSGKLYSQQDAQLTSSGEITNSGTLSAQGSLTLNAASVNSIGALGAGINASGVATQHGNLLINTAQGQTIASGTNIAGGSFTTIATDINLANSNTNAADGISLTATAGNINLNNAVTQSVSDIILTATGGAVSNNNGMLLGSQITSHSTSFINTAGEVYALGNLGIIATTDIINSGSLSAKGNLTLHSANLNSSGALGAGIDGNGKATQNGNIEIITSGPTVVSGQIVAGRLLTGQPAEGGNLRITATDINLSNSATNAVSGIVLNSTAGNINLSNALTQSLGDIILTATGSVLNDQGILYGAAITSTSAGFSNAAGNVYATGDLNISSSTSFTNAGSIYSLSNAKITATGGSNITNTGQMSAQGNLELVAANVNSPGTLGAGIDEYGSASKTGNITITTLQGQSSSSGQNIAGGSFTIAANNINLSNSTNNAKGIVLTANGGNIDLVGASVQSVLGAIVLNATSGAVNNTDGNIFGDTVTINSISLTNSNSSGVYDGTKGVVGAIGDITLTANSIDNTNGKIGNARAGAGTVTLDLNHTGNLNNAGGRISSDADLVITANTISGSGTVVAGNDATIDLQGDYTNSASSNVFKVNHDLTITTSGNFINQTALEAVGAVTVNAVNITNELGYFDQYLPTGAYINGNTINLVASGNLSNQGILNAGSKVTVSGVVVSNTASIFGGSVSVTATQLIENVGPAAIIGARDSNGLLELLAPTIQNRDDTTATDTTPSPMIIGLGQVVLAGGKDSQNQYINATQVLNQSALIQSGGNMLIAADTLTNTRRQLTMSSVFAPTGATDNGQATWTPGSSVPGGAPPFMGIGGALNSDNLYTTYTGSVSQNSLLNISPISRIRSGGDIDLHVNTLQNYWSQIAANGNITLGGAQVDWTQAAANGVSNLNGITIDMSSWRNNAAFDAIQTTYSGDWVYRTYDGKIWNYSLYMCNWDPVGCSPNAWGPQTITTPLGQYESSITAHGSISGSGATINNVAPSSATTPLGANSQNNPSAVTPSSGQFTQPGSLPTTQPPALNNLTLPQGGLYSTNTAPQAHYLVETNPAFTNHSQWLSSDWYFTHANIDPSTIQKRLGDGYYEQQLIRDELMSLTGRTLLSAYGNEQDQFRAMMTSGAQVAVALGLSPGIGLNAEQVSKLTSNVIIMETRVVQGQKVLVPVVYLAQISAGDLLSSGPLIAANNIILDNTQGFTNSGTIRANNTLAISGQSLDNRGGNLQSGGLMHLNTVGNIDFTSANVQAGSLALNAGGNLLLNTGAQQISMHNAGGTNATLDRTGTLLGRIGSLNVTGDAVIQTGGNFELNGAQFKVGGDLATDIKGNWLIGTQQIKETTTASAPGTHSFSEYVQNIGSVVQVGGQSSIKVGNDIVAQGAQINLQGGGNINAGGNVTLGAAKDSFSSDSTGTSRGHFGHVQSLDETLIGTNLQSGQGLTITSGKDTTISSSTVNVSQGNLIVAATGNLNVVADTERHESSRVDIGTSHGLTTTTQRSKNDETWRTDSVGSSLSGNNVSLISGNDINIVGSNVTAEHDITVAAVNDVNISAATDKYGSTHYANEHTSGLQATNAFSITDQGPETTSKSRTDGTNQSYNRSGLTSNSGNLTIAAGGNLIASGTDLAANAGALALSAGGTVAILAGQDTLTQDSSTQVVTNPNAFTKQRKTITDSSSSIDSEGSTLSGNSVTINSGADIILQGTQVTAGKGGIDLDAKGDIKLLTAVDSNSHSHQETLATDGYTFRADGSLNDTDTRRKNNKAEGQTVTNQVTSLVSGGNIRTHSGGDTLIEASILDAQGTIHYSATGYETTYNDDGSVKQEGRKGTVTFAGIKDTTYTSIVDSSNSMPWQSSSGHGEMVETLQLANIKAGGGITYDAAGGIVVDIPVVPATPAPKPKVDAQGNPIPVVPLTPEQQATQQQAALDNHIQALASKPGQEWIAQLAQMAKEKPDAVKLQQVNTAVQHWDYAHDGLTQEAVAVIVIVVTYFTAGAGSSAVGTTAAGGSTTTLGGATLATTTTTAAGATVTTYSALGAAINAGFSTLASQATVALINNHGDIGHTLNDLGKSENVKATIAAMLSAGITQGLANTDYMHGVQAGASGPLTTSSILNKLELNLTNATVNTAVNSAVYGTSFTHALGTNLQNAGIDTIAAVTANVIGQSYKDPNGYLSGQPVLHDLAHAALGCATAAAKKQDCGSGALGGVVGEVSAELIGGTGDVSQLTPAQHGQIVFLTQLVTAGAAITTGSNLNTALATSNNAVVNNYLSYNEVSSLQKKINACNGDNACINSLMAAAIELSNSRKPTDLLDSKLSQDVAAGSALLDAIASNVTTNGFTVSGGAAELLNINSTQQAAANAVPVLTAPQDKPNPYYGTLQAGLATNLQESVVIAGVPTLMAVPGTVGALTSLGVVASGSYQFGQGLAAFSDGDYGTGVMGMGLGTLAMVGGRVGVTSALGTTAASMESSAPFGYQPFNLNGLPAGSTGVVNVSTGEIQVLTSSGELVAPPVTGVHQIGQFTPPANLVPGTTTFGNVAHQEVADLLQAQYPNVPFVFRVLPGETGVDVTVPTDFVGRVGYSHAEIKPLSPSGMNAYQTQINNWGLDPATVKPIYYDSLGHVYLGK